MADDTEEMRKRLGIHPTLAGLAMYEGLPVVSTPLLAAAMKPVSMLTGKPVPWTSFDEPIQNIAAFSRKDVKVIERFARSSGVRVPIVGGAESAFIDDPNFIERLSEKLFGSGRPMAKAKIQLSNSSVPIAMHEIGHATPIAKSHALRRMLQSIAGSLGGGTAGQMIRGGIVAGSLLPEDAGESNIRETLRERAPYLVGATFLPELAEEGRASYLALKGARAGGVGMAKTLGALVPGYGSYAIAAAVPIAASILAKRIVEALRENQAMDKESAAIPQTGVAGKEISAPGALTKGMADAWNVGGQTPPKPKTTAPSPMGAKAKSTSLANKIPSNAKFHGDLLKWLHDPGHGYRGAVLKTQ